MSKQFSIQVSIVVTPDGDEYYAYCPELKGLHTCGTTEMEALENARDAVIAYVESLKKHGDPLPLSVIVKEKPKFNYPQNIFQETIPVHACP